MAEEAQGDVIRLLPDSVANQIAAGEVIQRPASVIKELVENSVDAGARSIEIYIKDAGKTLIQVVDDGIGMSTTDARMAFERHATSKIRCADDLFSLHTMGFRGEALPSIAAVSELEVVSRRLNDELGTKLIIRASHVDSQEPATAAKGTNIKVKNLFYNFVARRRFLKKDSIELSHIVHEFERLALVNTDVAFKFTSNGTLLHSLARGPLKERIQALFGRSISDNLIPVNTETSLVRIDGFVSVPAGARQRGQRQFLFVNGRNMRHPYFHKAILSCYDNLIAKDAQPHYFINFHVAPDRLDVNIHPQKHEIKFEDEQSIWQILTASIRETLGRHNVTSAIEFNTDGAPEIPTLINGVNPPAHSLNDIDSDTDYNPFLLKSQEKSQQKHFDFGNYSEWTNTVGSRSSFHNRNSQEERRTAGWQDLYDSIKRHNRENVSVSSSGTAPEDENNLFPEMTDSSVSVSNKLTQFRGKYIVTEARDGLLFIDQHRAHVNILYNTLLGEANNGEVSSQSLMFNDILDLDAQERVMLDSSIEIIEKIGFRIGHDNHGNPVLDGVPGSIGAQNPVTLLHTLLADLSETGNDIEEETIKRLLLTMSRSSAIRAGQVLTVPEMEHIISSLFRLSSPAYTPDGLKVIYRLTDEKLALLFQ